jgi:hypothetical protein
MYVYLLVGILSIAGQSTASADTAPCDVKTLQGRYSFAGTAWVEQRPQTGVRFDPLNEIGLLVYDGKGGVSLTASVSFQNKKPFTQKAIGEYSVMPDCTAIATLKDSSGAVVVQLQMVFASDGKEISTLYVRPTFSMSFTQKKR